jgi:hypothetical protein
MKRPSHAMPRHINKTDYGRLERTNPDRPTSAIGAGSKGLPRQADRAGLVTGVQGGGRKERP